jgi:hypothetical protein
MPIRQFIGDASFEPQTVIGMTTAFNQALGALQLVDRTDPIAEMVARKIIEIARRGERDPKRICPLAMESLKQ